jgi:hypothetical protein
MKQGSWMMNSIWRKMFIHAHSLDLDATPTRTGSLEKALYQSVTSERDLGTMDAG